MHLSSKRLPKSLIFCDFKLIQNRIAIIQNSTIQNRIAIIQNSKLKTQNSLQPSACTILQELLLQIVLVSLISITLAVWITTKNYQQTFRLYPMKN